MSRHLGWRLLAVIALLGAAGTLVLARPARLGLDLRGGTQIVLQAQDTARQNVDRDTVDRTLEVLRRRVDQLGVTEPTLQRSGDRRVIVELPGVYDPTEAVKVIGRTAQLEFHPVLGSPQGQEKPAGDELVLADERGDRLRLGPAALSGGVVGDARAELDPRFQSRWQVAIEFRDAGGRQWADLTGKAACEPVGDPGRRVAIVLDRQMISSPQVDPSIQCGQGISGGTTVITGDFTDKEARDLALLIRAGALPVPVQVVEQRTIGPTLGAEAIDASTKAAIIGVALTVLFLIVYYRLLGGLSAVALLCYGLLSFAVLLALRSTLTLPGIAGFVLAIGMAVDANVLVFERMKEELRAGAGLRPAVDRGFRNALSAIVDSNVTTLLAAALLFFLASGAVRGFGVTLSVGVVVSMFTALVVTRVLVELALRWRAVAGRPRLLGVESGGRFNRWLQRRRPDLVGGARWWLAGSAVLLLLRRKALIAVGIALAAQLAYMAVRFRWTFGAAAVVAMFHDVAILLGLFAWLGKPLDGVFLAALLTVIGYSVNDSVVVFDRIRERLRERRHEPLTALVNDACLQTVPRTVNTGLGAMFILAALFALGGDTLTDFALALLVGILIGTYSSVFVAAPLVVTLERGRRGPPRPGGAAPARERATAQVHVARPRPTAPGGRPGRQGSKRKQRRR